MARGYLGKISAIVAVNTDDARSKLSASAKDFQRYARSVQSTIGGATSSAGKAFDNIFTPLQRLQRALAATQNGNLGRTLGLGIDQAEVTRVQQLVSAAEQLARPLSGGVSQFSKLSTDIQGEFQPALVQAQRQVELARVAINQFGSISERSFSAVEQRVISTTRAISRLTEVQSLVDSGRTGQELAFRAPRVQDELSSSAQLSQQAASLPVTLREDPSVRARIEELARLRQEIAKYQASVERRQVLGLDTQEAQARLDGVIRRSAEARAALEELSADGSLESGRQALGRKIGNGFLNVLTQSDVESDLNGGLGRAVTDPARQIDVLRGSVSSLESQLLSLPASIQTRFIPQVVAAREEFLRLRALGPDATAEAIENAGNEVDRLGQQLRRVSQVQALPSFADSLNETSLRGAIGSLNAFQQILSRIGATAGSELGQAFDRMRAIIKRATRDGTVGTQAFQQELRQAAREAANLAAQTGRISANRAFREIQRGGDIARGGFDRLSLATQQAAFALDDFFSVQGDFSQRIRAVQNNITQLAFILGGTPALFVAIGTAIAAQAAVGLVRWYNEGRTAEDQTRALNDALARQKSLVEELARAFESLGDSIADRAFSRSAQEARAFQRELDAIIKKQREAREAAVADAALGIGAVRADQNRINRQLQEEVNPGRRAALQQQLAESQQVEQRLRDRALAQGAPGGQEVRALLDRVLGAFEANASAIRRRGVPATERTLPGFRGALDRDARVAALPANIQGLIRNTDFGNDTQAIETQIRALKDAIGLISPIAGDTFFGFETVGSQATKAVELIRELASRLESIKIQKALDDSAVKIFESGNLSARRIEEAQNSVAEAIEAGVPGARAVERRLNSLGTQLEQAFDDLEEARAADPSEQASLQANAQSRIDRIRRQQVAELAAADSLRRENTLNPERQVSNVISRIESAISSIGSPAADIQGRLRELQFERESVRQQRAGIGNNPFAARRLDNQEQALTLAIRSLEDEVNVLSEAFNGFNREVDNRLRPQGDATRGLDRFETPGERARRELEQTLADIAAAADALEERVLAGIAPNGIPLRDITDEERNRLAEIERRRQQADDQTLEEQMRASAPAIFGLADSVQNAVLQGPSRAALNASDISTQEGARELNRLLRGEDSARDQNLIELQRQSTILGEMLRDIRTGVNNVAAAR